MKVMRKRCRAAVLIFSLLVGSFSGAAGCRAEVIKEYYLLIDNTYSFRLNNELYEQIQGMWNNASAGQILDLLRQVYGNEQVPPQARELVIQVHTYTVGGGDTTEIQENPTGAEDASDPDFDILSGQLMGYLGNSEIVTIPNTVTGISKGAFYKDKKVKKIIVPASVKSIDRYAFYECKNLKYIVFAGKSKTVDDHMIYQCDKLTNIVAPEKSKEYKYAAEYGIRVLTADRTTLGRQTMRQLVGDKEKLVLYNTIKATRWKSSNPAVVSVSASGRIQCRKKGTAQITAESGGKRYQLTVYVEEKSEDRRIQQIVQTTIRRGMSTREKIKAVHDWLIRNVKYDYYNYLRGAVPNVSHTSKGALLRGVAVCDGYSKAMNKIMRRLGIPCQMVVGMSQGGGHAWNRVKVDGKWLYIDVTFDDPIVNGKNTNTKPYYMYFLKTAKQMRRDHSW